MVLKAAAAIISAVLTIASVGYQIYQSQKLKAQQKAAQKARDEAEDARKGFEQVIEGDSTILPIIYGRAMIGGARVFHAVSGNFNYVESNADKTLGKYASTKVYKTTAAAMIAKLFATEEEEYPGGPISKIDYVWKRYPPHTSKWSWLYFKQVITYQTVQLAEITETPYVGLLPYDIAEDKAIIDKFEEQYPESFASLLKCTKDELSTIKLQRIITYDNYDFIWVYPEVSYSSAGLNTSIAGTKNEFLFYQQALCQGPIEGIYDVVIDDSRFLNDVELGNETENRIDEDGDTQIVKKEAGIRIDCHYGNEARADAIMAANFYERANAVFNNIAYASVVIRLERDYPQFNNIPNIQFFVQGKKVKTVGENYQLSTERIYSNNPAWCLLDYLLDSTIGKGLNVSEIDLVSFYNAAQICDRIVLQNIPIGGNLYLPVLDPDSGPLGTARVKDIRLYECNIIINSEKTIRENIEEILASMGDARLVWSQGKYKLSLQYPTTNDEIELATILTDDDLILNQEVQIAWPSASERLNHCLIKYHNEVNNFSESIIGWPPKKSGVFWMGLGASRYSQQDGFDSNRPCGQLLNSMGVWANIEYGSTVGDLSWIFYIKEPANNCYLTFAYADLAEIQLFRVSEPGSANQTINQQLAYWHTWPNWPNGADRWPYSCNNTWDDGTGCIGTIFCGNLPGDCLYKITIHVSVGEANGKKGIGAYLWNSSDIGANHDFGTNCWAQIGVANKRTFWKTTDIAYTGFVRKEITEDDLQVYNTMLLEDSNVELEKEVYVEGITDYYHALAKAEEYVRTSRSAATYKFTCNLKNKYLEPADFIKIQSEVLNLEEGVFLRVSEVKINDDYTFDIVADRFDYTQLAWNVADNEYIYPGPT